MNNFQSELQMLGMDQYQVGELIPIDYQSQNPLEFSDMRRCGGCGGCGRCGGFGGGFGRCGGFGFRCGGCFGCGGCGGCGGFRSRLQLFWLLYLIVGMLLVFLQKNVECFMKGKCPCLS